MSLELGEQGALWRRGSFLVKKPVSERDKASASESRPAEFRRNLDLIECSDLEQATLF